MTAARPDTIAIADFGKTRSKVAVLTAAAERLVGVEVESATLAASADGTVNVDALGRWCEEALADLYWEYPFTHLLPVTHGATAVALKDDKLNLPVRDYEAPIDTEIAQSYEHLRPAFSATGSPVDSRKMSR